MKHPNMLSATFVKTVKTVKTPGRYGDGRGGLGLSLLVRTAARGHITKCWTQSVRIDRRPTSIGLSRYPAVTLALARQRAPSQRDADNPPSPASVGRRPISAPRSLSARLSS